MRRTTLVKGDLEPSAICLGGVPIGSILSLEASFDLLDAFLDLGGNFIDTAKVYSDWLPGEVSSSEKTIGRWLKARNNRTKVILGTKGAHPDLSTMSQPRLSREHILSDLSASLSHLQTDYIDIYWLHRDDPNRPVADILEVLEDQVRHGTIRYYGCSNWLVDRIQEAHAYASQHQLTGFIASQPSWSFASPIVRNIGDPTFTMNEDGLQFHQSTDMAVIPYSSQAGGFFTKVAIGGVESVSPSLRDRYASTTNLARLKRAQKVAEALNATVGAVALAYLMAHPFPVIPIVGAKSEQQLRDSLMATNITLSDHQFQYLVSDEA